MATGALHQPRLLAVADPVHCWARLLQHTQALKVAGLALCAGHHEAEFGMSWCALTTTLILIHNPNFNPRCAGHHEAEFGMSWCAGFNGDFWRGYHSIIPKEPGRVCQYLLRCVLPHVQCPPRPRMPDCEQAEQCRACSCLDRVRVRARLSAPREVCARRL